MTASANPKLAGRLRGLIGKRRCVFIVGIGRDGSTLVQALLNTSRLALVRGENALVLESLSGLSHHAAIHRRVGAVRRKLISRLFRRKFNNSHPWFGYDEVNFQRLVRNFRRMIIRQVIRPLWWHRLVGFKEIRWADFPDSLAGMEQVFPSARYVVIHRDAHEVSKSGWWPNLDNPVEEVERRQRLLEEMFRALGDRVLLIHYSQLSHGALEVKVALENFLGVRFPPKKWNGVLARPLIHKALRPPWDFS